MIFCDISAICTITSDAAENGMPEWANLVGSKTSTTSANDELAGGGIYACFWDKELIYIGSFVGPEEDPFGGNVTDRIYKHVMGLTLRAKALGFNPQPLGLIIDDLDHQIARDLEAARKVCNRLECGSIKATFNKACFAKLHWEELRRAEPKYLLDHFSFAYGRPKPPDGPKPEKRMVKRWITRFEKTLIQRFNPICNTAFRTNVDGSSVGFDDFAEAFNWETARLLPALSPIQADSTKQPIDVAVAKPNEADEAIPEDPRWVVYYTQNGQLRVRAVSAVAGKKGRTLLCRMSPKRIFCLVDPDLLAAVGVEAHESGDGTLPSAVVVNFNGEFGECAALLHKILEACLVKLAG